MGTKERIEIINNGETVINKLLKRVSNLELEVEKLEKNERYKYMNGQAYFRQDYVLGREKEIERLQNKIEELMTLYTTEREVKEDYKSIIKEVREYIEHEEFKKKVLLGISEKKYIKGIFNNILEILDKEKE